MATEDSTFVRENELPDDFLNEIDKELEALSVAGETIEFHEPELPELVDTGVQQMHETYLSIARTTLAPIDRYMKALRSSEHPNDILEICELIVTPLISKTENVGLNEHADDLIFFRSLLVLAMGERDPVGMDAMREVVMEGFSKLSVRFDVEFRGYRLAVRNLIQFYRSLKNAEGVHEADIRRFFAVGIPSLTWIRRSTPEEMSNLSGVETDVVAQIRNLARTYRSVEPVSAASLAKEEYPPRPVPDELSVDGYQEEPDFSLEGLEVVDADVLAAVDVKAPPRGQA